MNKDDYTPKKFDLSKGGIHFSNPPEEYGLGMCVKCDVFIESKDWNNPKLLCDDCKEEKSKDIKVYTNASPPKNYGVYTTYKDQLVQLNELVNNDTKEIFFIGSKANEVPFYHRDFIEWTERFGKGRKTLASLHFKDLNMIYFTYRSLIYGLKPDIIIIVNVHLFDVKKWWQILNENVIPMVNRTNKEIPVIYWRW